MRNIFILVTILLLVGCSYSKQKSWHSNYYVPDRWLSDPRFSDYKEHREGFEEEYLGKNINYEEYRQRMKKLNEMYDEGVRNREDDHSYNERWIF